MSAAMHGRALPVAGEGVHRWASVCPAVHLCHARPAVLNLHLFVVRGLASPLIRHCMQRCRI